MPVSMGGHVYQSAHVTVADGQQVLDRAQQTHRIQVRIEFNLLRRPRARGRRAFRVEAPRLGCAGGWKRNNGPHMAAVLS